MLRAATLFDLTHTLAGEAFENCTYPWEVLKYLDVTIPAIGRKLDSALYIEKKPNVWVHVDAQVAETAHINAPCIIDANTEVRHCAFIRGNALIGENCVVGNSVEIKNAILFDNVQVCHFNYVGDSILGYFAHMGAGAITSNVRLDYQNVLVRCGDTKLDTGMFKLGALVGDHAEVGCNSVLNPGTILGRYSRIYPLTQLRGYVPEHAIVRNDAQIAIQEDKFT